MEQTDFSSPFQPFVLVKKKAWQGSSAGKLLCGPMRRRSRTRNFSRYSTPLSSSFVHKRKEKKGPGKLRKNAVDSK